MCVCVKGGVEAGGGVHLHNHVDAEALLPGCGLSTV